MTRVILPDTPVWLLLMTAVVLLAAWVLLHRRPPSPSARLDHWRFSARTALGFLTIMACMACLQRVLVFATNWPLWPLALAGAACIETVLLLYRIERSLARRRARRTLGACRVALIVLVLAMLLQPIRVVEWQEKIRRTVAVAIDHSESMWVADSRLTPGEKVRLAEALMVDVPRRPERPESIVKRLAEVRGTLAAQGDWLSSLGELASDTREEQLERRRRSLNRSLREAEGRVAKQIERLSACARIQGKEHESLTKALLAAKADLERTVHRPLAELADKTAVERAPARWIRRLLAAPTSTNRPPVSADSPASEEAKPEPVSLAEHYLKLLDAVRLAATSLAGMETTLTDLGYRFNEAFYFRLPAQDRVKIDAAAMTPRAELARRLLLAPGLDLSGEEEVSGPSPLDGLAATHDVRIYKFGSQSAEVDVDTLRAGSADSRPEPAATTNTADRLVTATNIGTAASWTNAVPTDRKAARLTDIADTLERVMKDIPTRELGAIVLMTDGRHNAVSSVEPLGRRLGMHNIPVCSVVFGAGTNAPTDAAIVTVSAPDMAYQGDCVYFSADIKVDGPARKSISVRLFKGDTEVDRRDVNVTPGADHRRTVELAHEPKQTGLHHYRVVVDRLSGEAVPENNERSVSVNVTKNRTKVLLVDGRPSWEFRYVKNLFSSRDPSIQLQYVLLEPDVIPGEPPRPRVPASATRDRKDTEATALPADASEWMKFDVVILGDVPASALDEKQVDAVVSFVGDRGGTLVVLAGPRHMPHEFTGSPLAELLPVVVGPADKALMVGPEKQYRLELTPEGRASPVMRLKVDPEENLAAWAQVPPLYWRHAVIDTKEGAGVLAYARPEVLPSFMKSKTFTEGEHTRRREFIRRHALVVHHHFAKGRVMFLGFNRTWRLRYRMGDTLHHKFWGQTLRWAAADTLPFGTPFARIGTDRSRYAPGSRVRLRAKLVNADHEPITGARLTAAIMAGEKRVLRRRLDYVPDSVGLYEATLGPLEVGRYRAVLNTPPAARGTSDVEEAVCEFSVEPDVASEIVELTADRGLLSSLASLTGGSVFQPPETADIRSECGPGTVEITERKQLDIWNSWPLLAMIVLAAATEWLTRKREQLP